MIFADFAILSDFARIPLNIEILGPGRILRTRTHPPSGRPYPPWRPEIPDGASLSTCLRRLVYAPTPVV